MNMAEQKRFLYNLEKPIDFLDYYENLFYNIPYDFDESKFIPIDMRFLIEDQNYMMDIRAMERGYLRPSIKIEEIHNIFCSNALRKSTIKLCKVCELNICTTHSARRSDSYSTTTEYILVIGSYRVDDKYLRSILPEKKTRYGSCYNDSTPGFVNETKESCKINYLETERFFENYEGNDHCNYLSERLKSDKYTFGAVEKQIVFHEFGHLFGYCLSKIFKVDFGEVIQINLKSNSGYIILSNYLFRFKPDSTKFNRENEILRIKNNLNESQKRTIIYIMYLLFGGIFNMYCKKVNPTYVDFQKLYEDNPDVEKYNDFSARGGSDFQAINNLKFELKWGYYDFEKFKYMAFELYYILNSHFIFGNLLKMIESFDKEYNGKLVKDSIAINKLVKSIDEYIARQEYFIIEINLLIEKYISDINIKKIDS